MADAVQQESPTGAACEEERDEHTPTGAASEEEQDAEDVEEEEEMQDEPPLLSRLGLAT